jgi:hypothetical protein
VLLDKDRMMDNVQKHNICINGGCLVNSTADEGREEKAHQKPHCTWPVLNPSILSTLTKQKRI